MKRYFTWKHTVLGLTALLLTTGCTSTAPTVPAPQTVPVHNVYDQPLIQGSEEPRVETALFKQGRTDGCKTANGKYTKDRTLFNSEQDYHEGWFAGRQKCQKHAI